MTKKEILDSTVSPLLKLDHQEESELEQQIELENVIKDLEEENSFLMEEYRRLQKELSMNNSSSKHSPLPFKSSTMKAASHKSKYQRYEENGGTNGTMHQSASSRAMSSSPTSQLYSTPYYGSRMLQQQQQQNISSSHLHNLRSLTNNGYQYYSSLNNANGNNASAMNRLNTLFTPNTTANGASNGKHGSSTANITSSSSKEAQIINEARLLRQHEDRLEARMRILENHNRLLDSQLKQLKGLLNVSLIKI